MKLAIFDFDKTITRKDSFIAFILSTHDKWKVIRGFLILFPTLMGYFIKLVPNYQAKQRVFGYFWAGRQEEELKSSAILFSARWLPLIVKKNALERIAWHKQQGHKVVVVSASLDCYLEPWCREHQLDLLSTEVEYKDGVVTGAFSTENCYAQEKVNRLKARYNLRDFEYIYAYGDGRGDREMLQIANEVQRGNLL